MFWRMMLWTQKLVLGFCLPLCGVWRRPFAGTLNKVLGWYTSVNVTARKTRNVIQGCGQGKLKSYFAQVPVVVSPWSDIRATVLLLVFIEHKQVLFLGQLLLSTATTYINRLPRSPAPSRVLCCFMCWSTYFTFCAFFFFNWGTTLDCSEWSTVCFPLCSVCHGVRLRKVWCLLALLSNCE